MKFGAGGGVGIMNGLNEKLPGDCQTVGIFGNRFGSETESSDKSHLIALSWLASNRLTQIVCIDILWIWTVVVGRRRRRRRIRIICIRLIVVVVVNVIIVILLVQVGVHGWPIVLYRSVAQNIQPASWARLLTLKPRTQTGRVEYVSAGQFLRCVHHVLAAKSIVW